MEISYPSISCLFVFSSFSPPLLSQSLLRQLLPSYQLCAVKSRRNLAVFAILSSFQNFALELGALMIKDAQWDIFFVAIHDDMTVQKLWRKHAWSRHWHLQPHFDELYVIKIIICTICSWFKAKRHRSFPCKIEFVFFSSNLF